LQVVAQVIGFLLAGYETTANTMAFLVYFLSTHPEAQQKLQQEVDDVLGGRAPTLEDIPKVTLPLSACA
jgi:cytochrome P450